MLPEYRITAGFMPLTDSLLLVVARERGFAAHLAYLRQVTLFGQLFATRRIEVVVIGVVLRNRRKLSILVLVLGTYTVFLKLS